MSEDNAEPLAKTRTRRSNAGARMHEMMFAAEDDPELLEKAYGLRPDEDSSDDEEYIPKDLVAGRGDSNGKGPDEDDDESVSGSGSDDSGSSEDSSSSDDDEEEEENEEDEDVNAQGVEDEDDECQIVGIKVEESSHNGHNAHSKPRGMVNSGQSKVKRDLIDQIGIKQEKSLSILPGSPSKAAYKSCAKICTVCLGDNSGDDDEIIECDACGVTVHEGCYEPQDDGHDADANDDDDGANSVISVKSGSSDKSHISIGSADSMEPWFCEPCRRSVKNPHCELCPNTGGIFKETDTGRWVHMVCALYTRGVTFENVRTLSDVSLFELNYSLYGSKACSICEDRRLARSGVCIGCDAGLCKTVFHATCAQKEGLLFELQSDEIDPYIAQCKHHADKSVIRKKKRICTALFARLRRLQPLESCSDATKEKLAQITQEPNPRLSKWNPNNRPPIPQRVNRSLMTSPSLIIRLTKKSELMGLDPKSAFMSVQDEMEMARQKWHIPPAFSLEFVAYVLDRTNRMVNMKKTNIDLSKNNVILKDRESSLRDKYNELKHSVDEAKVANEALIKEARAIQKSITNATGKQFNLSPSMEQLIARCSNTAKAKNCVKVSKSETKSSTTYQCGKCTTTKDQHLLSLCDTCNSYIHIYCLDPPLTRVPKKTKFGGWQCSDCTDRDEEEQEEALEEQNTIAIQEADGPRRLRDRIKYPEKYCHESMALADFWSSSKRRSKKSSRTSQSKRVKIE